jgi:hypothetical protein
MLDLTTWKPTAPYDFADASPYDGERGRAYRRGDIRAQAIEMLVQRGYVYAGADSMGLPCFRSRSGAMLIGVGSCRCLAYAKVDGRLQVVAAARTLALLCRIGPERTPGATAQPVRSVAAGAAREVSHPEPVLMI